MQCFERNCNSPLCQSGSTLASSTKICAFTATAFELAMDLRLNIMEIGKHKTFSNPVDIWIRCIKKLGNPRYSEQHFCGKLVQVIPAVMLQKEGRKPNINVEVLQKSLEQLEQGRFDSIIAEMNDIQANLQTKIQQV